MSAGLGNGKVEMGSGRRYLFVVTGLGLGWIVILGWLASGQAQAGLPAEPAPGVIRVASTGNDTPGCGAESNPCRTVQYGIDLALPGDEVRIAGGVYTSVNHYGGLAQVAYVSKTLTLRGGFDPNAWSGPAPTDRTEPMASDSPTTLDAEGKGRALFVTGTITVTVEGLHLTGGDATGLGGGHVTRDAGGGMYAHGATAAVRDCRIYSNTASSAAWGTGGGLYLRGGSLTLSDSTIMSNTAAVVGGGFGGGLYLDRSSAVLIDSAVTGNTACEGDEGFGGGLYFILVDAELRSNVVEGNTAGSQGPGDGGGLYLYRSDAVLEGNIFQGNISSTGGAGRGGGLHTCTSNAVLRNNSITGNTASTVSSGSGGGLFLCTTNATLTGNTIVSNTASTVADAYGGGLSFSFYATTGDTRAAKSGTVAAFHLAGATAKVPAALPASSITLTNNLVAGNRAGSQGGGLWFGSEDRAAGFVTGRLLHNTIADNGDSSSGQGLYARDGVQIALTNTILAGHADAGVFSTAGSTVTLEATLWYENGQDAAGSGSIITGSTNVHGDPAFVNPAMGDYHLGADSAALDQGADAQVGTDIDGQPRPYQAPDLGADEYWPPGVLKQVYLPLVLHMP